MSIGSYSAREDVQQISDNSRMARRVAFMLRAVGLTRHKISDREPGATSHVAEAWMASTQEVNRSLAYGSLHRLVRSHFGG